MIDVLAVGEALALVDPDTAGPLESIPSFSLRVAGAELNALIGLARLGHRTAFVSAVGDDPFGRKVRRILAEERVDATYVNTGRARTGVFFKERLSDHGRRVYYYRDGSAASKVRPETGLKALEQLRPRIVLGSGLTLGIGGENGLGAAAEKLVVSAHERGVPVVFDANLRPTVWYGEVAVDMFDRLVERMSIVLAGQSELATLLPDADGPEEAAGRILGRGCTAVVVKHGRNGSVVYTRDRITPIDPVPVSAVDPIGAGDAFAAGLVSGMLRGWSIEAAARLGSHLGARAVSATGDWEALPRGSDADDLVLEVARGGGIGE